MIRLAFYLFGLANTAIGGMLLFQDGMLLQAIIFLTSGALLLIIAEIK